MHRAAAKLAPRWRIIFADMILSLVNAASQIVIALQLYYSRGCQKGWGLPQAYAPGTCLQLCAAAVWPVSAATQASLWACASVVAQASAVCEGLSCLKATCPAEGDAGGIVRDEVTLCMWGPAEFTKACHDFGKA